MAQWDTDWADGWMCSQAKRSDVYGAATERMLDLADLCTGNRVLDVAAGTGEQTLLAAQRVGPSGYVLATDISTDMLNIAADAVRRAGLTNVGTRVMDGENLDLEAGLLRRSHLPVRPDAFFRSAEGAERDEASG